VRPSPARLWWLVPLAAAVAALATLLLDRETGFPAMLELRAQVAAASAGVGELRETREGLLAEIEGLRRDAFSIEGRARSHLGMVRPGERVLRFATPSD
jgi:cell division protein FtsB